MTRDEIINFALARLRDPDAIVFKCEAMCNYVNDAYLRVIGANPHWPFLEQEIADTSVLVSYPANSVTLPTDAWKVLGVLNTTDNIPMREITGRKTWAQMFPLQSDAPGPPLYYRIFNDELQVFPYPTVDTQLRVEYPANPGKLTAASSVPVFPSQYHGMLVEYVMGLAYQDDGNPAQAQVHMAIFLSRLQEMVNDLLDAKGDSYAQINDDLFY